MLSGIDVVLGLTLWVARPKELIAPESPAAPRLVAVEGARRSMPALSACDPEVDKILVAWEKATVEAPRTRCSFLRFRYDHHEKVEYRGKGEISVYQNGTWDYRAERTNIPPVALRRMPAPGNAALELREDSAEQLLVSRESVTVRVTTESGTEERTIPTFCDLFDWSLPDWLLPFISKEPELPRRAQPGEYRPIDILGLPFARSGVTPSAAIVPTFLAGMRREELLKRFEVTLIESKHQDQLRLRFKPRGMAAAEAFGEVRIILSREGYLPHAMLMTFTESNSEIVHVFQNWTFAKPAN